MTKRTYFDGVGAINRAVKTDLKGIPEESFQLCIEASQWKMKSVLNMSWITLKEE